MAFVLLLSASLLACASASARQAHASFRVFPSVVTQTEPVVAVHPADPSVFFASAVTINTGTGFFSEGVYVSTDGGMTWFGSDTCKGALLANHGGDPGVGITPGGKLILTHIGSVFAGVYGHTSTDMGATWSNAVTITSQQPEDKGTMTVDDSPESPRYGNAYAAFVNYVSPYPVLCSATTDGGASWSAPRAINPSPPARCSGGSIETGRDGTLYACWSGVSGAPPFTEDFAGFASSPDGGATWSAAQNVFDMNGVNGTLPAKSNIRVNGLPQIEVDNSGGSRAGWLYIVTTERGLAPAGSDPDIILHRSSDGGAHWSAGMRVNQDEAGNGKIQYFPAMAIDSSGGVNIIFYDDRRTSADSAEVMLARSEDGGTTWNEAVVSDHRFKPKPIYGGSSNYQGDHIALACAGNALHAFWMDDRSGIYQVWSSVIDIAPGGVRGDGLSRPTASELGQNYPNPFNPSTQISYSLARGGGVSLSVFDVTGRRVALLVRGWQAAGSYVFAFDGAEHRLAGGVYYYRLEGPGFSLTRPMVFVR